MSRKQLILLSILSFSALLVAKILITGPDPLIDFGRELYIAWQLSVGKVLYRDIFYHNGPLSPYLNALWFRLFGLGIHTLALCNLIITLLILFSLFSIFIRISTDFATTFACATFILLFAFSQLTFYTNYNYIFPYSHEMTHGMLLSVLTIVFFARFLLNKHPGNLLASGFALGLAFLTKAEISLAISCALLVGLTLMLWVTYSDNRQRLKTAAAFIASAITPIISAWLLLSLNSLQGNEAFEGIAGTWLWILKQDLGSLGFYRHWMGTDNIVQNLKLISISGGIYILYFAIAAALDWVIGKYIKRWLWSAIPLFLVAVVLLITFSNLIYFNIVLPSPTLMAFLTIFILIQFIQTKDSSSILKLTFIVFAFVLLMKMGLRPRIYNYGFVLGMPATLVCVLALLDWIPKLLVKHQGKGSIFRMLSAAFIICIFILPSLNISLRTATMKPYPVSTGNDKFLTDKRGLLIENLLIFLSMHAQPGASLMVVPQGAMINYLARMENPTGYTVVDPLISGLAHTENILKTIKRTPPDYFVLPHIDMSEHGVERFGHGYAEEILQWVQTNYEVAALFGNHPLYTQEDGILLLRLKKIKKPR